ncbi:hypothetical protein AB0F30_27595 [Streptomyces sp. NPDC029006]|uniref:hypothetical protein n=1 Tax=Streptomyces sp. NPDC029006 TaxID=3155467 RepID=UPI0033EDFF53
MAKKPKNRSNCQTRQAHQARGRLARQRLEADAAWQAAGEAFDQAFETGCFTVVGPHGQPV